MKNLIFLFLILSMSCTTEISSHLSDKEILLPELFLPNIVTTEENNEFGLSISPVDAKTIFFTRRVGNEKQRIYSTKYNNGKWSTPEIADFSTDRDESPSFSKDGKTLYFGSERPIPNRPNMGNFDVNVWKTTLYENEKWSNPKPLPKIINEVQVVGEEWPSSNVSHFMTTDDKTFYAGTQVRGDKGLDIYKTTFNGDTFTELEKLPNEINREDKWEYAPILSYDGNYIFFQVYKRDDGIGGDDIFVSKKDENGNWMSSKNLGSIVNTELNECPASITADGKYFFFTRALKRNPDDEDGIGSIFFIETKALKLETLFK